MECSGTRVGRTAQNEAACSPPSAMASLALLGETHLEVFLSRLPDCRRISFPIPPVRFGVFVFLPSTALPGPEPESNLCALRIGC